MGKSRSSGGHEYSNQQHNANVINNARESSKSGNWHDGDTARLNRNGISDLDYLEDQVNQSGFVIDNIRNQYNHNNITLHHPDHPDLDVVVDKLALHELLSNTSNTNLTLSNILTKVNNTMSTSNSFINNTNTVTIASRFNDKDVLYTQNDGSNRNLVINLQKTSSQQELFNNINDYIEQNR